MGNLFKVSGIRKRIKYFYAKMPEICHVARDHYQLVYLYRRRDHRIFIECVGRPMHESGPGPEGHSTHWKDIERAGHPFKPLLDGRGLGSILFAGELDACLYLAYSHY